MTDNVTKLRLERLVKKKEKKKKNGVRLQTDKKRGRQLVFDSLGT